MADNSLGAKVGVPVVLPVITGWTAYTPSVSGGLGSTTALSAFWRRVGDKMEVIGSHTNGTVSAAVVSFSLPAGHTVGTAALTKPTATTAQNCDIVGEYSNGTGASGTGFLLAAPGTSLTVLYLGNRSSDNSTNVPALGNSNSASSAVMTWRMNVPIAEWAGQANLAYGAGNATSAKSGLVSSEDAGSFVVAFNGTGFSASQNVTVLYQKVGKQVTLEVAGVTATGTNPGANFIANITGIPTALRPQGTLEMPCVIYNAGSLAAAGKFYLSSTGIIRFYRSLDETTTFTNSAVIGWGRFTISYLVV